MEQFAAALASRSPRDPAVAKAMAFWKKTIPLDDADGIWKKVMIALLEFDATGELPSICHGYNTCQVESFYSSRAGNADKTKHWHANWEPICEVTLDDPNEELTHAIVEANVFLPRSEDAPQLLH